MEKATEVDTADEEVLQLSSDASFADDPETRKSTQGYLMKLFDGPIMWQSSKQKTVTTSTTEAVQWVQTTEMPSDGFTKPLAAEKHSHFVKQLGWLISPQRLIQSTYLMKKRSLKTFRCHLKQSEIGGGVSQSRPCSLGQLLSLKQSSRSLLAKNNQSHFNHSQHRVHSPIPHPSATSSRVT